MKIKNKITVFLKEYYFKSYLSGLLLAGLTVVALAVAFQQFYIINADSVTRYSLLWHVPFNLFYFWYWFLIFPAIYWITNKFRIERSKTAYWICIYLVFPIALVLVHQVIASLVINVSLDYLDIPALIYRRVLRNPWLGLDVVIYFAVMISINVFEYREKNRSDAMKLTQLHGQLATSQLNALQSQLHPHFLFNTLNTVSTLVLKKEQDEVERMLSLLRGFLETTIYGGDRHAITLKEELDFINRYLEIEKVRFADRLEVVEEIDPDVLNAGVPNFLLQPIVENAIRYAVAPMKARGRISIRAGRGRRRLTISVEDNGPGLDRTRPQKGRDGVGLKITRERLARFFGEDQLFEMTSPAEGGTRVKIEIPFIEYTGGEMAAFNVG